MLVFASWYWRLDAGGPHGRAQRLGHPTGAFLFPQMTSGERHQREKDGASLVAAVRRLPVRGVQHQHSLLPTDTAPLSRWAKGLMMIQAVISLAVTAILVSRAVNIL